MTDFKVLDNYQYLAQEKVTPNEYNHYRVVVPGHSTDIVVFKFVIVQHSGSCQLYCNVPPSTSFPTEEKNNFSYGKGTLEGPAGDYYVSVKGGANFSIDDDEAGNDVMTQSVEQAVYDIQVEWRLLTESETESRKKVRDQYKREASSSVWSNSYSQDFADKYAQQTQDFQRELEEREQALVIKSKEYDFKNMTLSNKYDVGNSIARGGVATVFELKEKATKKQFALKLVDKEEVLESGTINDSQLVEHVQLWKTLKHTNLCDIVDSENTNTLFLIIMEFCDNELIKEIINKKEHSEEKARHIIEQLLNGIKYMHTNGIVHHEIVPDNILIKNGIVKLSGFSFITKDDVNKELIYPFPQYQPPEVTQKGEGGKEADMWQIGIIAYILLTGYHPFNDSNARRNEMRIRKAEFTFKDEDWSSISSQAKQFIQNLICVDTSKRLTADAALNNEWIKGTQSNLTLNNVIENLKTNFN